MGKKKNSSSNPQPSNVQPSSSTAPVDHEVIDKNNISIPSPSKTDSVSKLKEIVDKLAESLDRIAVVMNSGKQKSDEASSIQPISSISQSNTSNSPTPAGKDAFQRPDMTAEEKKAQRAAKAAEKKARADAAAAKKAETSNAGNQNESQANKEKTASVPREENGRIKAEKPKPIPGEPSTANPATKIDPTKSSLKTNSKNQTQGKEVQFDMSATLVKSLSGSEEALFKPATPTPVETPNTSHIHPAFLALMARCEQEEDLITDLDQLCIHFIHAFKQFVSSWDCDRERAKETRSGIELDLAIRPQLAYLTQDGRWHLPLALGNIVRQMKKEILKIGKPVTDKRSVPKTVSDLQQWLDEQLETNFQLAYDEISNHLQKKIHSHSDKAVMTYEWSPLVNRVLLDTSNDVSAPRCCVVDPEINGAGIKHVKSLIEKGIRCQYTDLRCAANAMQGCSMILLGCSAVLSNGCVVAPRGSLQMALTAKAFNVPLLVTAQTFKFVDKAQTYGRMALLNEKVELVPSDLVTAIVTELRILHPCSAPAVLKAKALES